MIQTDKYTRGELIPRIRTVSESKTQGKNSYGDKIAELIFKELDVIKSKRIGYENFKKIGENLILGNKEDFVRSFEENIASFKSVKKKFEGLSDYKRDELITKLYDYFGLFYFNIITNVINNYFSEYFNYCQYIAPIRASAQRYYRSQGLSVETITPQGENVPMLLDSMTTAEKEDWNGWTKKRFGIEFLVTKNETNISVKLRKKNGKEEVNLADTGFGFSQLLPILLYVWKVQRSNSRSYFWTSDKRVKVSTLVIEQPELHLHPAMQAELLDVFVELINYINEKMEFRIIMETHSETIINRLGYHVAFDKDNSLKDKVNIVIFDEVNEELSIHQTVFNDEGYLENWPIDFFMPSMEDY